ncbi:MAG: outer membrane lipoprotein LolB [Ruminobacter sp.]|nr:outer membrane lipoprotein LolB [Ruminobacter sp.]
MNNIIKLLTVVSLCGCTVLWTGCNSLSPAEQNTREQYLASVNQYSIRGKLAIFEKEGKGTALLNLQVDRPSYTVYLTGAAGGTLLKIDKNERFTEITDDKGNKRISDNADALITELTGYHIPCDTLPDIITALPKDRPHTYASDGTVETIVFPEFTVTYKNYTKQKDVLVPKKLDIKGNDFLLRINITKWEL